MNARGASFRSSLISKQAFKDYGHDAHVACGRREPELGQLRRIDNRFGHADKHFDHQTGWYVFANDSRSSPILKDSAEITLNHVASPALHHLEYFRRFSADVADERGLNLFGVVLHASQKLMQRGKNIFRCRRHDPIKIGFDAAEFIEKDGTQQIELARERGVEGFLAHTELFR